MDELYNSTSLPHLDSDTESDLSSEEEDSFVHSTSIDVPKQKLLTKSFKLPKTWGMWIMIDL